jgi:hypothetical protein
MHHRWSVDLIGKRLHTSARSTPTASARRSRVKIGVEPALRIKLMATKVATRGE